MQKIVEEVLKAEETAKILVQKAREEAEKLKSGVELEVAEKLKKAREEAQEFIKSGILKVKSEVEEEYQAVIKDADISSQSFLAENADQIESLVQKVLQIITLPEFNRE